MLTPSRRGRVKAGPALAGRPSGLALIRPSTTARWFDRGPPRKIRHCRVHRSLRGRAGEKPAASWSPKASAPPCPERDQQMSREESRGRRDPSRQGRGFTAEGGEGRSEDDQATGGASQRNGCPVVHMRCRMTASLRATAIVAFFLPIRLVSEWPQACRSLGFAERLSSTFAAS